MDYSQLIWGTKSNSKSPSGIAVGLGWAEGGRPYCTPILEATEASPSSGLGTAVELVLVGMDACGRALG